MKALVPGHCYTLENFDQPSNPPQILNFIHKEPGVSGLVTVKDGTTNEELLLVLIDRMNFLQAKFPCRENALVLTKLEESLMWLNKRTADRKARGVEGTNRA